jgi:hypothetical protein
MHYIDGISEEIIYIDISKNNTRKYFAILLFDIIVMVAHMKDSTVEIAIVGQLQ